MKTLQLNPDTVLPGRTKELIGLGVAAQIPCRYCIVAHTEFAKLNGASEAEIGEAVAMAAITRHWSTYLNGIQTDETKFRAEIAKIVENVKKAMRGEGAGRPAGERGGRRERAQGSDADARRLRPRVHPRLPEPRRAPAPGETFRDVQLTRRPRCRARTRSWSGWRSPRRSPASFCVIAHTEFAKLNGATDAEIKEALGMASLTRELSTMMNGLQVDEAQFRRDVDKLVKGAKAAKKNPPTAQR